MLEVRHLRLVRAIADEGGPTRAAARLHLTQSAVSHQLAELEGRLGVALFSRVRRRLELTPAGARLLEAARSLLAELARVERELHTAGSRGRETLRLAVECFTSYHWLPPLVAALAEEYPHVDVRIVAEATREPVSALLRGSLDLAIVSSPVLDRELETRKLFDDEWTVVMAKAHPLASRPWVSVAELGGETLYGHAAPRSDVERFRELMASEGARMPHTRFVPFTGALVDLVSAGLGVAVVSRWAVAPWIAEGSIVARRLTRAGLPETWSATYRKDSSLRPAIERFLALWLARAETSPGRGSPRTAARALSDRVRKTPARGSLRSS